MSSIKTVAVAGASGNIGRAAVSALLDKGFSVTALTRAGSSATFPSAVRVVPVDYESIPSLQSALAGQDAVVSAVASLSLGVQPNLVEAATLAGVKRFMPAEFGADLLNPNVRAFPILYLKVQVQEQLVRKYEETGMTYTLLFTGVFLDWGLGLETGMILDVKKHEGTLWDDGSSLTSASTLATVGRAIASCLIHEAETKNRGVRVQDRAISQNQILEISRKIQPDAEWKLTRASVDELIKQADEAWAKRDPDIMKMMGQVIRMHFGGPAYGEPFGELDNELLGIEGMSELDLEKLVRKIALGDN